MAHLHATPSMRRIRSIARQRGLTLIELMVSLIVGLLVILAAISVFSSTGRSAGTVDAAGQLRDDARFAADIIQRLAVQTGFEDIGFVTRTYQGTPQTYAAANGKANPLTMKAPISGISGKTLATTSGSVDITAGDPGGSDVLVLRYQPVNLKADGTAVTKKIGTSSVTRYTDNAMINCAGFRISSSHGEDKRDDRAVSIFYVDNSDGEPTLFCRYAEKEGDPLQPAIPLVKGVESFKVLYGVDNIAANTKANAASATEHAKLVPTAFFDASKFEVSNNTAATETNWRRVRALRVGLVLRAGERPIQSGQALSTDAIHPLGEGFGSSYTPNSGAGDSRLRQNYIFTINVRNCLNQGYQAAGDPGKSASDDIPPCDVIVPEAPSAS